jgi:hypothetical protein
VPRLYGVTGLERVDSEVRRTVREAHVHFSRLLERTAATRGITIGGYKTSELDPVDLPRRGGLAAKDLVEAAFRCYAAGLLKAWQPFQNLLIEYPDLRLRSEIIAIHRDCWEKLRRGNRLRAEPWENTFPLVVGALLEQCNVNQVDFGWLLETGRKPDFIVVEQLRRGLHAIERLRHDWFEAVPPTNATQSKGL